jgi:hypothetical protein
MIAALRRARWISALLLALSPALGGGVLPLLHPCPVEAPWLDAPASAPVASHAVHAHHQAPPSHSHGPDAPCTCVGTCHSVVAPDLTPSAEFSALALVELPSGESWPSVEPSLPRLPADLLPPTTAPPIA